MLFLFVRFHVMAEAIDGKDSITISLNDRTVRTLIGKTVIELLEEVYLFFTTFP